jgi:hypothetical protein
MTCYPSPVGGAWSQPVGHGRIDGGTAGSARRREGGAEALRGHGRVARRPALQGDDTAVAELVRPRRAGRVTKLAGGGLAAMRDAGHLDLADQGQRPFHQLHQVPWPIWAR